MIIGSGKWHTQERDADTVKNTDRIIPEQRNTQRSHALASAVRSSVLVGALLIVCAGCALPQRHPDEYLLRVDNDSTGESGYHNLRGEMIIPMGKYVMCITDTFRIWAAVAIAHRGFVAIDRDERILYDIFNYDNGPDYIADGLFRILRDGTFGYADGGTGEIVIEPQYECAWPFENGVAKVSLHCTKKPVGEIVLWDSDAWFLIDKHGTRMDGRQGGR